MTALTANNLAKYEEIRSQLEGTIVDIQYIGNYTYKIKTDKKDYLLVDKSDYFYRKFNVFEMKAEIEIFKNPM